MRSFACTVVTTLLFSSVTFAKNTQKQKLNIPYVVEYKQDNILISMEFDYKTKEVSMCADTKKPFDDDLLSIFLGEIVYFTEEKKPVKLGNSGYSFLYRGGYPQFTHLFKKYVEKNKKCLTFAYEGKLVNKTISAEGKTTDIGPSTYSPSYGPTGGYGPSW